MTTLLTTLADLALELETGAMHLEAVAGRRALKAGADLLAHDAREQIGHYQPQVGAYPEWAPLAESTEDEKAAIGAPADAPLYRFGQLQGSFRSESVSDEEAIAGSIDPVMEYHEFGTSKMPPRPALGPALFKNIGKIQQLVGNGAVGAIVAGQRLGYRFSEEEGGIPNSGFSTPTTP